MDMEFKRDYINDNVNDLSRRERIEILTMVLNSIDDRKYIKENNQGTCIRFNDMSDELVTQIHNKIKHYLNISNKNLMR